MRTKIFIGIVFLLFTKYANSQDDTYLDLVNANQITKLPNHFDELNRLTFKYYLEDIQALQDTIDKRHNISEEIRKSRKENNGKAYTPKESVKKVYYNNVVLNKYFSELITNYATNTGDLSFSNYFINTNTSDKTLTIGKSFRFDNLNRIKEKRKAARELRPIKKVGNIMTLYARSNLSENFSSLYSKNPSTNEYRFNSNLGIGVKYTHVFNGSIINGKTEKIKYIRENLVKPELLKKLKAYDLDTFERELAVKNYGKDETEKIKNKKSLLRKKFIDFYAAIAEKELEYLKSENLITSSSVLWFSVEGFYPIAKSQLFNSIDRVTIDTTNFRNWNAKITGNYLRNKNYKCFLKKSSIKATAELSFLNTNNFVANSQSAVAFQNIIQDNSTSQVEGTSSSVFLGEYNEFVTSFLRSEISTLSLNNSVGLSAAYEVALFGEVINRNWKLGIPFSLKDKDKKPTVNFELQWREINRNHTVGIAVGYNFGRFIK